LARFLGGTLGYLASFALRKEFRRAEEQLEQAFPDHTTQAERRKIARGVFRHFGKFAMEMPVFLRWGAERIRSSFEFDGFDEVNRSVRHLMGEGNGIIVVVPHMGNWELASCVGSHHWPSLSIAKRYKVPGYQRLVDASRRRLGGTIVYQDEPMLTVVRHLKRGGLLGLLPDLDAKRLSGIFVPFFGRDAYTTDSVAQLSIKLGCPIVSLWCVRDGADFRFECSRAIRPEEAEGHDDPERELTLRWLGEVEGAIRRHPDQWVWLHDRYHSTPETLARRREREQARDRAAIAAR
ncbi:MAG: hypothetical protein AAF488_17445, partial [Planctomycetota bacterium]